MVIMRHDIDGLMQSVALTFLDMIGQMGAAGFVFLAHDKTQNRNRYANFQLLMTSMCHMSSVCVQSAALALIGAVLSVAILAQVGQASRLMDGLIYGRFNV